MSMTYKAVIYKAKDGHKHAFDREEERMKDAFLYYEEMEGVEDYA